MDTIRNRWSTLEETVLVRAVFDREETLFGPMNGCGAVKLKQQKCDGWSDVAEVLNSQFVQYRRDAKECRKKFHNLKQKAKNSFDAMRNPKTGGGAPKPLSASEALMLDFIGDRASVAGVDGAVESTDKSLSEVNSVGVPDVNDHTVPEIDAIHVPSVGPSAGPSVVPPILVAPARPQSEHRESTPVKGRKATKRNYQELAESTLLLDNKKTELEMQLLQSKLIESKDNIKLIATKQKKLDLEIDCLNEKKGMLTVKKELLEMKLKSSTDFSLW